MSVGPDSPAGECKLILAHHSKPLRLQGAFYFFSRTHNPAEQHPMPSIIVRLRQQLILDVGPARH